MTDIDVIFAGILDSYVEIMYNKNLHSIRFIKSQQNLPKKVTQKASLELDEYFKGKRTDFSSEFDLSRLSAFAQKVLYETSKIKYGKTITYSELADKIGSNAVRGVGRALSNNPIPIIIPCHRVVAKKELGGYSAGVDIKKRLLEFEKDLAITFNS
jgi:methylated-DNA-[protein]-cysteine S-methyltransferase